jgi:hypothetical protein
MSGLGIRKVLSAGVRLPREEAMKRQVFAILLAAGAWLAASTLLAGDHCCRHGGCPCCAGAGGPQAGAPGAGRMYDPDTVTTLRGTAAAVDVMPSRGGREGGLHLTLDAEGQAMEVHLGPTWFLQREGLAIAKGDVLEVTGSVVELDGAKALIARELKKGGKSVALRDEQGIPAWSGRQRP